MSDCQQIPHTEQPKTNPMIFGQGASWDGVVETNRTHPIFIHPGAVKVGRAPDFLSSLFCSACLLLSKRTISLKIINT